MHQLSTAAHREDSLKSITKFLPDRHTRKRVNKNMVKNKCIFSRECYISMKKYRVKRGSSCTYLQNFLRTHKYFMPLYATSRWLLFNISSGGRLQKRTLNITITNNLWLLLLIKSFWIMSFCSSILIL